MQLRDHSFLGTTQSLCPECLRLVTAKIVERQGRVYFRKHCPEHGVREDFVCSDVTQFDQMEYCVPGKVPHQFSTPVNRGCPYDCGLCTEHEQHTCIGLVEITSSCNLRCPMCYASSAPGGKHSSFEECKAAIDRLVEVEGRPEVLQLSGGEPTIHPEFVRILRYAAAQPIDAVMINTNGLRLATDDDLVKVLAEFTERIEVYLQFDGFREDTSLILRGESLVARKLAAIENLSKHGVRMTLVCTLQGGVNDDEIGDITRFGLERRWITGISFQPATYSGRHVLPSDLERRMTFPDVIQKIVEQTDGLFRTDDFMPLPCAHPNCHSLTYLYRNGGAYVPLTRFIDAAKHPELLANGIMFTKPRVREMIERYLGKLGCCAGGCSTTKESSAEQNRDDGKVVELVLGALPVVHDQPIEQAQHDFLARALAEKLTTADVFRITITSFLDAYNFDIRRLMKCCVHHVLPSGHVIPFCAYNVLYREGHVPLPAVSRGSRVQSREPEVSRESSVQSREPDGVPIQTR
jgi:uncharacterized radical SAM superfamily Fe-S cluster-containing enzyme